MTADNIPISTNTLIDIMRVLDATSAGLGHDLVEHTPWFNLVVQMLGPELTGELDGRARGEGLTVLAHLEDRAAFLDKIRDLASDLAIILREQLSNASVEFDEYS